MQVSKTPLDTIQLDNFSTDDLKRMLGDYDFFVNKVASQTYLPELEEYLKKCISVSQNTLDRMADLPKQLVDIESEVLQMRTLCEKYKIDHDTMTSEYQERIKQLEAFQPDVLLQQLLQESSGETSRIAKQMQTEELNEQLIACYLKASSKQRYISSLRELFLNHIIHF